MRSRLASPCPDQPLSLDHAQASRLMACEMESHDSDCTIDLHWGFFFDGTNNNLWRDRDNRVHSNVGRLYDVFDVDHRERRRLSRYIPGVGTRFREEIGDTGQGIHAKAGLAAGWAVRGAPTGLCSRSWTISTTSTRSSSWAKHWAKTTRTVG